MPIDPSYITPSESDIDFLKTHDQRVEIENTPLFKKYNAYFKMGLAGTIENMFIRKAILDKLNNLENLLAPKYSFLVFDAFRSLEAQMALFDLFKDEIRKSKPGLTEEQITEEAAVFVAHPDFRPTYSALPHNTGGAIDLALCHRDSGEILEFGCEFDNPTDLASTKFFEAPFDPKHGISEQVWMEARVNRRILFNLLIPLGFANYSAEWWHFNMGDSSWGTQVGCKWSYGSME
ncbi:MAG: D-alanyl-D-alanine dipeptidase [Bacteriovoracaceae bacterium]|jgi:zinc D-Ala-D-Ala dipeptidase|nr:D-alanyl-D-alanine dipeptidase [Bacteriovoracaceae bacterium]